MDPDSPQLATTPNTRSALQRGGCRRSERRRSGLGSMLVGLAATVMGLSGLTACSSSGSAGAGTTARRVAPTTTAHGPSTTLDRTAADKAEITALYKDWHRLNLQLHSGITENDDSRLEKYLAGPELSVALTELKKNRVSGERWRVPSQSVGHISIEEIQISDDIAIVKSCEVNDLVVETSSGAVLDDRVGTYRDTWEARRLDDGWRMWTVKSHVLQAGVGPCGA